MCGVPTKNMYDEMMIFQKFSYTKMEPRIKKYIIEPKPYWSTEELIKGHNDNKINRNEIVFYHGFI